MGSNSSKAAQSAARKFPTRAPGAAVPPSARSAARPPPAAAARRSAPAAAPAPQASQTKDESIRADSMDPGMTDPGFAARLHQMGIVTPSPTLSNSSIATPVAPPHPPSTSSSSSRPHDELLQTWQPPAPAYPAPAQNQTLTALEARRRLQEAADRQLENPAGGRALADVGVLRQALVLRRRGTPAAEVERRFRLRPGVVAEVESGGAVSPLTN